MPRFKVTEVLEYEVEADTPEDAIEMIIQCDDPDTFCTGVSARYADELRDTPVTPEPVVVPPASEKELVAAVIGGVFPMGLTASIRPVVGSPANPGKPSQYMTMEQCPHVPPALRDNVYPSTGRFELKPQLFVGDIDSIIAKFSGQIRMAYSMMQSVSLDAESRKIQQTAYQAAMDSVWSLLSRPGAVVIPWDWDKQCAWAEQRRNEITAQESAREFYNTNLGEPHKQEKTDECERLDSDNAG